MYKKIAWLAIIAVSLFFVSFNMNSKLDERIQLKAEHELKLQASGKKEKEAKELFEEIQKSHTSKELQGLYGKVDILPIDTRDVFKIVVDGKKFEARFREQERLLSLTRALLQVNENDKIAKQYLAEAKYLHQQNIKFIDDLKEIVKNCNWNYSLHYLTGLIYYRGLVFVKSNEKTKAQGLIEKSLESFEKALECAPKNRNAETAIEILYDKAKNMDMFMRGDDDGKIGRVRLEFLPPVPGDGPGNKGSDRERGRH